MKKVKLVMPAKKAQEFSDYLFNNAIHTLVSYTESETFGDSKLVAYIVLKEENVQNFESSVWKQFVK